MTWDIPRFYMPELDTAPLQTLSGTEALHAVKVLRMQVGDELALLDGRGSIARAELHTLGKKELQFSLISMQQSEQPKSDFHLVMAPTKNADRVEWCLEKCTELGLSRMTLIITQNSERRKMRMDRLEKIAIAAMKQSHSLYLPELIGPIPFHQFIDEHDMGEVEIAHCRDMDREAMESGSYRTVMIGPEGDFTEDEIESAVAKGARAVHLGDRRLRTETAAMAACVIKNL